MLGGGRGEREARGGADDRRFWSLAPLVVVADLRVPAAKTDRQAAGGTPTVERVMAGRVGWWCDGGGSCRWRRQSLLLAVFWVLLGGIFYGKEEKSDGEREEGVGGWNALRSGMGGSGEAWGRRVGGGWVERKSGSEKGREKMKEKNMMWH